MTKDETYMQRCLQLAKLGLGSTRPNPSVGSVVVHNNMIIGEGYTSPYGGSHAEINAINSVADKSLLKDASLYVTLEPCSHYGKTPPCTDLIIRHKIPNVFIGTIDSNEKVSGTGIEKLKTSGCNVSVGILENECKSHHKRFLTFHNQKRPYIILKWAESRDGFIAPLLKDQKKPVWLTNNHSRQLVHKWRTEEQAILVGTNTVKLDNPSLTARDYKGHNPIRVVIDRQKKLSNAYHIFNELSETITISEDHIDFNKPIAHQICSVLHKENIQSLIVEGGTRTLQTFIDEGLWDEARVFTGDVFLTNGVKAPKISGTRYHKEQILQDHLRVFQNSNR